VLAWVSDLLRRSSPAPGDGPLPLALTELRSYYAFAVAFSAAVSVLYLSSAIYMMLVYDKVLTSGSLVSLLVITIALVAALATLAYLDTLRGGLLARAGLRMDRHLSGPTMAAMLGAASSGDMQHTQRLRDLDQVRGVMTGQPALALMDAPWAPVYLVVLFIIHWSLAALAVAGGILFLLIAWRAERRLREPTRRANDATAAVNSAIDGTLRNAGPVRALGMSSALVAMWDQRREVSRGTTASAAQEGLVSTGLLKFLRLLWQSLALGLGALLAIDGRIAPGAMIAGSILLGRTLAPLEQIVGAWRPLVSTADAYARLKAALWTAAPDSSKRTALPALAGRVEVDRVIVRGSGGAPILAGVSFALQAGETLGIIGATGAGKSTLVRALFGLTPVQGGTVRFDGAEISHWRPQDLARSIGYLPQETALLPGTVRDNVSRFQGFSDGPSEEIDRAVVAACQLVGIHDDILRLPQGYDTAIETGGTPISGGQRQRIALARAIYRDPSLVVMDEPSSHLDLAGEAALVGLLRKLREGGRTVILVTHRANLLATAHKVLSLVNGQVQHFGTRDEVMSRLAGGGRPSLTPVSTSGGGAT
jgi:PrtD family type I secretion system ABC transporter